MILILHIFFNFLVCLAFFSSYLWNFLEKFWWWSNLVCEWMLTLNECNLSSLFFLSVILSKLSFSFSVILVKMWAWNLLTSLLVNIILSTFCLGFYNNILDLLIIENMSISLPWAINFIFSIAFFWILNTIYTILYFKK